MTNIPLKANVTCSDGPCGLSTNVIVNPINQKVTHFALRDKSLADNPTRLVPAGMVAGVEPQQITLTCSKADVEAMPPFIVTNFIPQSAPGYAYATGEAYYSQYVVNDTGYDAVNEPAIPAGEEEVHSGMHVLATDGKVGKLDALVLDPDSGVVTHILLREGHLWGKKDVAIPVAEIKYSDGESVHIKLDKAAVKELPAVPVKAWWGFGGSPGEIVCVKAGALVADPEKNFVVIMKDGKVYKNTLDWMSGPVMQAGRDKSINPKEMVIIEYAEVKKDYTKTPQRLKVYESAERAKEILLEATLTRCTYKLVWKEF